MLLYKRGTENPNSSLWASIPSLIWCPVMLLFVPKFVKARMCFSPFVPYNDLLFMPKRDIGAATISL